MSFFFMSKSRFIVNIGTHKYCYALDSLHRDLSVRVGLVEEVSILRIYLLTAIAFEIISTFDLQPLFIDILL